MMSRWPWTIVENAPEVSVNRRKKTAVRAIPIDESALSRIFSFSIGCQKRG
jgi:hypothetical protein